MSSEITRTTSARAIASAVRARRVSAVEVVTQALATVERINGPLNAIVTLNPSALDDARRIDARVAAGDDVGVLQ